MNYFHFREISEGCRRKGKNTDVKTEEKRRKEKGRQMEIRREQKHSGLMIRFKKRWKEKTGFTTQYSAQKHVLFFFTPAEPSESIAYTRKMSKASEGISVCKILNYWNVDKYFQELQHTHTQRHARTHTQSKILTHVPWKRIVRRKISNIPQPKKSCFVLSIFWRQT